MYGNSDPNEGLLFWVGLILGLAMKNCESLGIPSLRTGCTSAETGRDTKTPSDPPPRPVVDPEMKKGPWFGKSKSFAPGYPRGGSRGGGPPQPRGDIGRPLPLGISG